MRNPRSLYELHCLASAYGRRPSEVLGVADSWAAYQLDLACLAVAGMVEERTAPDEDGRPAMTVEEALGERSEKKRSSGFADPAPFVTGKMRIPESGVW